MNFGQYLALIITFLTVFSEVEKVVDEIWKSHKAAKRLFQIA